AFLARSVTAPSLDETAAGGSAPPAAVSAAQPITPAIAARPETAGHPGPCGVGCSDDRGLGGAPAARLGGLAAPPGRLPAAPRLPACPQVQGETEWRSARLHPGTAFATRKLVGGTSYKAGRDDKSTQSVSGGSSDVPRAFVASGSGSIRLRIGRRIVKVLP